MMLRSWDALVTFGYVFIGALFVVIVLSVVMAYLLDMWRNG